MRLSCSFGAKDEIIMFSLCDADNAVIYIFDLVDPLRIGCKYLPVRHRVYTFEVLRNATNSGTSILIVTVIEVVVYVFHHLRVAS